MSKRKNIFGWLAKCLLVSIFLIVVVMVFTPRLINLKMVKENIKEKISTDVGGRMTYRTLKLSYFPRPHVVIQKAQISIPDSFTIDIQWMRVYPKLLPLLRGRLEFAVVRLDYADYSMKLPQIKEAARPPKPVSSFDNMLRAFKKAVGGLPEFKLPDLNLRIKNGRVNLIDPSGRKFMLREVQAAYVRSRDKLDFSIKCKSNLWEQINVNGSLDPSDFKGKGRISLARFRPQALTAYLFPDSAIQISETRANVNIDFAADGTGKIKADVNGAVPVLELLYNREKLVIEGSRFKGALEVDQQKIRATISEFGLDYPRLNLAGMFSYDEMLPEIQFSLDGSHIDADSVRQVALKLAGQSEIIQILFNVIRGGHVPWMTVGVRGRTMADFGKMDNISIEGRMTRGKIYIPGAKLDLVDVFGDAMITGGILYGNNLKARFGNSHGHDGNMTLGFNNNLEPFHLNIGVKADLSQLPPVLNRIIPDKDFLAELARVKELKGTADGRLILGENLRELGARVEVSRARLTANYTRIPYPIKMDGGHFLYEGSRIEVDDFNAAVGRSSFPRLSAAIDWSRTPGLEAETRKAKLDAEQLFAWLGSFAAIKKSLAGIDAIKGDISVQSIAIKGPMFKPQKWRFQTRGEVTRLSLTSRTLPRELMLSRGKFDWQGSQIEFSGVDAIMGKSTVNAISGNANWEKRAMLSAQSGASIFYAEDLNPLVFANRQLAKNLKQFGPFKGNLAFNKMALSGPVSGISPGDFSGSVEVKKISLNSKGLPGPLLIDSGVIKWSSKLLEWVDIQAAMGKSEISRFAGRIGMDSEAFIELSCKTASLFAGEIYPFLASFERFQPDIKILSTSEGELLLSDIDLKGPLNNPPRWHCSMTGSMQKIVVHAESLGEPLIINEGAFDVASRISGKVLHRSVDLKTIQLDWGENNLKTAGEIRLTTHDLFLELTVDAERLSWNQINKLLDNLPGKKNYSQQRAGKLNVLGAIHVKSNSLLWNDFSVHPLEAEITFKPQKVTVAVNKADICGISFRGLLNWSDQTLDLYFVPTASDYKLVSTLACLTAKKDLATGIYNLNGEILAKAKPDAITRSLAGKLAFSAEEGRIYRFGLLAKLLAILNVTEIYRGEVPDLVGEGFAYRSMTANAKLQGGKIIMEECSIDGVSMGIACEGEIDLVDNQMDLLILVAPFKTVDRIVEILPLIGNVLGGKLISIPFKAKGNMDDPNVYALPPTAVGSGILGILERTLKLPITIIQPVFGGAKGGMPKAPPAPEDSPR